MEVLTQDSGMTPPPVREDGSHMVGHFLLSDRMVHTGGVTSSYQRGWFTHGGSLPLIREDGSHMGGHVLLLLLQ